MITQKIETHRLFWNGIGLTIRYTPSRWTVIDHIEIEADNRQPIPISETGYYSHFLNPGIVAARGGILAFVIDGLDAAAELNSWRGAQLTLF